MDLSTKKLKYLKHHVRKIAKRHAQQIGKATNTNPVSKYEFNIVSEAKKIVSMRFFHDIDHATLNKGIEILDASLKQIISSDILVEDKDSKRLVLPPYEVICLVFSSTDEQYRQQYFHELLDDYYQELRNKNMDQEAFINTYTKTDFDQQVKVLLPCIKIKAAHKLIGKNDDKSKKTLEELASNLVPFFKYPRLNLEDIYVVARTKLKSNNFKMVSFELVPLDACDGFMGDYFDLKVIVEVEDSKLKFTLFAKFVTSKLESLKEVAVTGPSKNEEFFYTQYLTLLEKHGFGSILDFCPKCYFSRINDVLILDNMTHLGFTALTPNVKLEIDSLRLGIKQMAKLHASSMLLEERLSSEEGRLVDLHSIYKEYCKEAVFNPNCSDFVKTTLNDFVDRTLYAALQFPELIRHISQDKLREKIVSGWELVLKQITKSEDFKNTICHGDLHVSNMLYRFRSDGVCEDTSLIDFQTLRYCPPVHDLMFFIYQNSFKDTRVKYYEELIEEYYLHVSNHLENFSYDPAEIYPKDKYKESIKYMKSQGLFQALYYAPFNSLEPSLRESIFANEGLADKYFKNDPTVVIDLGMEDESYRRVMYELIADLVEFCEKGDI